MLCIRRLPTPLLRLRSHWELRTRLIPALQAKHTYLPGHATATARAVAKLPLPEQHGSCSLSRATSPSSRPTHLRCSAPSQSDISAAEPPAPNPVPGLGASAEEVLESLSDAQRAQLNTYLDYLLEVNQVMNLTAVRDRAEAWDRHIMDSLALLRVIETELPEELSSGGLTVIDVGTGAGLPGMVLAVARPHWQVTLLDSLRKRCDFLMQAAAKAGLSNVNTVWARAELAGRDPKLRQAFDLVVARAVAETRVLAELCLPFAKVGGMWIAAKGANPQAEVAAARKSIKLLGGKLEDLALVDSYAPDGQRTAVVVSKVASTSDKYPRQPGTPGKKPL